MPGLGSHLAYSLVFVLGQAHVEGGQEHGFRHLDHRVHLADAGAQYFDLLAFRERRVVKRRQVGNVGIVQGHLRHANRGVQRQMENFPHLHVRRLQFLPQRDEPFIQQFSLHPHLDHVLETGPAGLVTGDRYLFQLSQESDRALGDGYRLMQEPQPPVGFARRGHGIAAGGFQLFAHRQDVLGYGLSFQRQHPRKGKLTPHPAVSAHGPDPRHGAFRERGIAPQDVIDGTDLTVFLKGCPYPVGRCLDCR